MKTFLKKFRSYKLVATIEGIAGLVGLIAALVLLILYQTNNTWVIDGAEQVVVGFHDKPIDSMIFFLSGILSIIFGIVCAYVSLPYVFPKDKKDPNKFLPWFGVAEGVFSLIEIIFAFIMISFPGTRHSPFVVLTSIFLLLSALVQLLMIYPTLRVRIRKEE